MSDADQYREPRLGDTIETVEPIGTDSLLYRRGGRLRVTLETEAAVDHARKLVALGRWRVVQQTKG